MTRWLVVLFPLPIPIQAVEETPSRAHYPENWYDPSDWFVDDNNGPLKNSEGQLDYEPDYGGRYWNTTHWHDQVNYTERLDSNPSDEERYIWDVDENRWKTETGPYDETHSYKMSFDDGLGTVDAPAERLGQNARNTTKPSQASDLPALIKLSGTIDGFTKMNLRYSGGFDARHSIARITLENGKKAVIDLGASSLVLEDMERGSYITMKGTRGQINGQNVFIATELVDEKGASVQIERALTFSEDEKLRSSSHRDDSSETYQNVIVLSGAIEDYQLKQANPDDGERTFVKLRLENGEVATVDLRGNMPISTLDLGKGDNVSVEGFLRAIGDGSVLAARTVSVEGEKVDGSP